MSVASEATAYKIAAAAAQRLPVGVSARALAGAGRLSAKFAGDRRVMVERNLQRVHGGTLSKQELDAAVGRTFASYAHYYLDTFRLPAVADSELDAGFTYDGFEHIAEAVESGVGPILVLPHLGSWEWAAFWLNRIPKINVTAIVEPLEPPEVFDWFRAFREKLGMRVVAVGSEAGPAALAGIKNGHAVCLLSDRVVAGATAVPVDFLGERTMMPAGAATLALRTGAPVIPVAVYQQDGIHFADVRPPIPIAREGKFRADVQRVTQLVAYELERFIRAAPDQWHLMQPNWPSDFQALGRPIPEIYQGL